MKNYIAIEGTDLVFTEKEWEKVKHTYGKDGKTRIVNIGKHKNRKEAHDYYVEKETHTNFAE